MKKKPLYKDIVDLFNEYKKFYKKKKFSIYKPYDDLDRWISKNRLTKHHESKEDIVNILEKCDKWIKPIILDHPDKKLWLKGKYPFKEYRNVYNLLKRECKEFIKELRGKCPVKGSKLDNIYDSAAMVIFDNKIDPWCFVKKTKNISLWNSISEDGQV